MAISSYFFCFTHYTQNDNDANDDDAKENYTKTNLLFQDSVILTHHTILTALLQRIVWCGSRWLSLLTFFVCHTTHKTHKTHKIQQQLTLFFIFLLFVLLSSSNDTAVSSGMPRAPTPPDIHRVLNLKGDRIKDKASGISRDKTIYFKNGNVIEIQTKTYFYDDINDRWILTYHTTNEEFGDSDDEYETRQEHYQSLLLLSQTENAITGLRTLSYFENLRQGLRLATQDYSSYNEAVEAQNEESRNNLNLEKSLETDINKLLWRSIGTNDAKEVEKRLIEEYGDNLFERKKGYLHLEVCSGWAINRRFKRIDGVVVDLDEEALQESLKKIASVKKLISDEQDDDEIEILEQGNWKRAKKA